ncbi:MAG: GrpB family protein [Flavobacteriales bacterium]|nr:GrpB family protein [Flavobacteriales bacterium]
MDKRLEQRIKALTKEPIEIVPYDTQWPARYTEVESELKRMLPRMLAQRITHIGSTAVPGLSAKPVIDVQVEVSDMERVKEEVVPAMEAVGYEFIWRPTMGDEAPFYAWFIKRNSAGERTVHVHMVEPGQASVDRIIFRDHLRNDPQEAARYEALKNDLARKFPKDRAAYTVNKTAYIKEVLTKARAVKLRK